MATSIEKYINLFTDFGFKKIFGTEFNKELLINFLNQVLGDRERILTLTYLNNEHLGNSFADRKAIFDLYCENDKGEKFIIELQNIKQDYFKDRSIFYSTFAIQSQAPKSKHWDYNLKAVYTIGILNFTLLETVHHNGHAHEVQLMNTQTKEIFYDKLTFIYLEVPKFSKKENELKTLFEKWMYVLKNLHKLQERPKRLQEKVFEKLFSEAEIAKLNRQEMNAYEQSLKIHRDNYAVKKTMERMKEDARKAFEELRVAKEEVAKTKEEATKAKEETTKAQKETVKAKEGLKKAQEERIKAQKERIKAQKEAKKAEEKGKQEEKIKIAKMLIKNGASIELVEKSTGLTKEHISKYF